jgi:hypothetical protein
MTQYIRLRLTLVGGQLQEQNHRTFLFCEKSRRPVLTGEQKQEQIQQMIRHHVVGAPIRIQMSVRAKTIDTRRRKARL